MLLLHLHLPDLALALQSSEDGLSLDELGIVGGDALFLHLLEPLLGVSKQRWVPSGQWTPPRVGAGDGIADGIGDQGMGPRKGREKRRTM